MIYVLIGIGYILLVGFLVMFFGTRPKSPEQQAREDEEQIKWLREWKEKQEMTNQPIERG